MHLVPSLGSSRCGVYCPCPLSDAACRRYIQSDVMPVDRPPRPALPEPSAHSDSRAVPAFGTMPPPFRHQHRLALLQLDGTSSRHLECFGEVCSSAIQYPGWHLIGCVRARRVVGREQGRHGQRDRRRIGMPGIARRVEYGSSIGREDIERLASEYCDQS